MRSLAQTQDLLQAVWQQNYHEFTDYYTPPTIHASTDIVRAHDPFFLAPPPPAKFEPLPRLLPQPTFSTTTSTTTSGMPGPFPNLPGKNLFDDVTILLSVNPYLAVLFISVLNMPLSVQIQSRLKCPALLLYQYKCIKYLLYSSIAIKYQIGIVSSI